MKKIILIEDDPDIQDATRLVLERAGYTVTIFSGGESVMDSQFELPDLFLVDKQLSGIDGLEVCRFLKSQESTRNIPLIMLSASPQIGRLSVLAGADAFLEKPYTAKLLREMAARYTGNNQPQ